MCGGIREFESLRGAPPAPVISLLHEEMKQLGLQYGAGGYGDHDQQLQLHDHTCSKAPPLMNSSPQNNIITTRLHHHHASEQAPTAGGAAAPAGLAILAAISSELVQSPSPKCSISTNQNKPRVLQQSQSPAAPIMYAGAAAARAPICMNPAASKSITANQDRPRVQQTQSSPRANSAATKYSITTNKDRARVQQSQSSAKMCSRKSSCSTAGADKKAKKKKSIFCSVFSPPHYINDEDNFYTRIQEPPSCTDYFMAACFSCKRPLGSGKDIYIYRGDRAFCSNDCRYQHIVEHELSQRPQQQNLQASNSAATGKPNHCKHRIAAPSPFIPVLG